MLNVRLTKTKKKFMHFRRIKEITDFRAFEQWRDCEPTRPHVFGKQTLILGANGSGKSTIADIAWAISQKQHGENVDARLSGITLEITNGTNREERADSDAIPRVLVFGDKYVRRNLARAFEEGEVGSALYVLGKENVELEKEIKKAESELDVAQKLKKANEEKCTKSEKYYGAILDKVKADVVERLAHYNPNKYNSNTFNIIKAKTLLQEGGSTLDSEALEVATSELYTKLDDIPRNIVFDCPVFPVDIADSVLGIAEYSVTSRAIDSLAENGDLAMWVDKGLKLHDERVECGFCGQLLPAKRIEALEAHFDASHGELMKRLTSLELLLDRFEASVDEIMKAESALIKENDTLRARLLDDEKTREKYWRDSTNWITAVRRLIKHRRKHPHDSVAWVAPPKPIDKAWDSFRDAISSWNAELTEKRNSIDKTREKAVQKILKHVAGKHMETAKIANEELEDQKKSTEKSRQTYVNLEKKLKELQSSRLDKHDGEKLARGLSEDLVAYLGHENLSVQFERTTERSGFKIIRGDRVAKDLSESEQNAIALLHFLRSLESIGIEEKLEETCLFVDDPVSSLDHDAILAAFSYLTTRLRNSSGSLVCRQVVVLTHNFEFFRLWKDALKTPIEKDLAEAKEKGVKVSDLPVRRAAILELQMYTDYSVSPCLRQPRVRDFSFGMSAITSEYYYLFARACESTYPEFEGLLPLTGNSTRRLLESFLKFKLPSETNFTQAAETLGKSIDVQPETVKRVVKALHGASHRTELDIHTTTFRSGAVLEIRAALDFLRSVDPVHFEGMCKATGQIPNGPAA